jgi:hypothetical protein
MRLVGTPLVAVNGAEVSNHQTLLGVAVVAASRRRGGVSRAVRAVRPATTAVPEGGIPVATPLVVTLPVVVTPVAMAGAPARGGSRGVVRLRTTADGAADR